MSSKQQSFVNHELTPQNAQEKGYRYITDVIDPYKEIQELIDLAKKAGYTFGGKGKSKGKIGLYKLES